MLTRIEQRRRENARKRRRQLALVAAGRCITCGREREPERAKRQRCVACAKRHAIAAQQMRDRLASEGLCEQCACPREPERQKFRRCAVCAAAVSKATSRKRRRK